MFSCEFWKNFKNTFFLEQLHGCFCATLANMNNLNHGDIILNRSNNSVFLRLKIYWNRQVFDLIRTSGIWMKPETLRHQASSSKF